MVSQTSLLAIVVQERVKVCRNLPVLLIAGIIAGGRTVIPF
jgi:hypothetical protein